MFDLKSLYDIAENLGIIDAVKSKLTSQSDPAADQLVIALDELSTIYGSIDTELSRYGNLYFDFSRPSRDDRAMLIEFERGEVRARMGSVRGHCHRIANIYLNYLTPWFRRHLSPNECEEVARLFSCLREFDNMVPNNIDSLADWLAEEASATLHLIDAGKFDEASTRIQVARKAVLASRRFIAQTMRKLLDLRAAFTMASGAIDTA